MNDATYATPDGEIRLARPRDFTRAIAIQRLANEHDEPVLAAAAALGLCWQSSTSDRKPAANWVKCKGAYRYAELIVNELVGRGWNIGQVVEGGTVAFPLIVKTLADLVTEDEVKAAENFTETPAG